MGKRAIKQQSSSKTSKKDHLHSKHHQQQQHHQQFNSLIKVLKPKVYITDSSSFKQLVQDLTGNNGSHYSPITSSSPKVHDHHHHDQVQLSVEPSVSTEAPTTTSSEEFCYNDINNIIDDAQLMMNEGEDFDGFLCSNNQVIRLEENDTVFEDILACDYDQINYLESLLFDEQVVAEEPLSNPFYTQIQQQEISVYDYDFSGLIN